MGVLHFKLRQYARSSLGDYIFLGRLLLTFTFSISSISTCSAPIGSTISVIMVRGTWVTSTTSTSSRMVGHLNLDLITESNMQDLERFAELEHNTAKSILAEGRQFYVYVELNLTLSSKPEVFHMPNQTPHAATQIWNFDATDKPM
eukprot:337299-Amphidinium_carterae.1